MGSSKTGSLDKFVPVSPAAAFASGKVKLPETGLIGMMQQNQEDKMAMNAANIAAQQPSQQQNQYNQMLQQMMMNQQRPSLYSPAPYANGGNVALRRKMFKLGGSASAHGTGLTSGLSFNQGGAVVKPGPDGKPRQHAVVGGILRALGLRAAPAIARSLTRTGRAGAPGIRDFVRFGPGGRPASASVALPASARTQLLRAAEAALLPVAGPVGLAGIGSAALLPDAGEDARPGVKLAQDIAEGVVDFSPVGLGYMALDKLFTKPSEYEFETLTGKPSIFGDSVDPVDLDEDSVELGMTPDELGELASQRQREDLEAAMAMYQDLIRGEDNTNKLATLGDAAIAAGSALMEGEGYGGAASAFNQPLAQARAAQQEADLAARGAAAQLAIGEDIARRQQDEALFAELAATGQFDTAEEIGQVVLARKFGITRTLPEDDKGEVDKDALSTAGAGVYVDPKTRFGGVFVAVDSSKPPKTKVTNDPEVAKQHAKS